MDDNPINREIFRRQLENWGGSGTEAESAAHGLVEIRGAITRGAPYEAVILDHLMPGMSGLDLAAMLRSDPVTARLPLVVATSADVSTIGPADRLADRHVRQKALELGVTDFLAKPVDPSEVRARVTNLLALRRSHLRLKDQNRWLADEVRRATQVIYDREEELIVRLAKAAEFRDPETAAISSAWPITRR